jgi:hypothetical protein
MVASPPAVAGRIFISYRRDDTDFPAGWLYERLVAHFGVDRVVKDVESITRGDDSAGPITGAVGGRDVLLVLIGDRWLTFTDDRGRRRLDDPDDLVRLEIEAALARGVRVIPILVGSAGMPPAEELPAGLAKLSRRHALELSPSRFESDLNRLVRVLDRTLDEMQGPPAELRAAPVVVDPRAAERDLVFDIGSPPLPPGGGKGDSPGKRTED